MPSPAAASAPATISSGALSPPNASTATRATGYGASRRSGSTSRPLYVPQVGQTRCGRFGEPHWGQLLTRGASIACVARRLSRRDLEVFLFGTAMSGGQSSRSYDAPEPLGSSDAGSLAGYLDSLAFP